MGGKQKKILEECKAFVKKIIQLFDRQCNSMHGEISGASELWCHQPSTLMIHGSETSKDSSGCIEIRYE